MTFQDVANRLSNQVLKFHIENWFGSLNGKRLPKVLTFDMGATSPKLLWMKFSFLDLNNETRNLRVELDALTNKQKVFLNDVAIADALVVVGSRFVFSVKPFRLVITFKNVLGSVYRFDYAADLLRNTDYYLAGLQTLLNEATK